MPKVPRHKILRVTLNPNPNALSGDSDFSSSSTALNVPDSTMLLGQQINWIKASGFGVSASGGFVLGLGFRVLGCHSCGIGSARTRKRGMLGKDREPYATAIFLYGHLTLVPEDLTQDNMVISGFEQSVLLLLCRDEICTLQIILRILPVTSYAVAM